MSDVDFDNMPEHTDVEKRLEFNLKAHLHFQSSTDGPEAYVEHHALALIRTLQSELTAARAGNDAVWNEAIDAASKLVHPLYQEPLQRLARPTMTKDEQAAYKALVGALEDIARQKTTYEFEGDDGDIEEGYDACIQVARTALKRPTQPTGEKP